MPIRTAMVSEGGGLRGAYLAGALQALQEVHGVRHFDLLAGSSVSVPTLAYFAAGQLPAAVEAWQHHVHVKELANPWNFFFDKPIVDADYLIDEVVGRRCQLDQAALRRSPMELRFPVMQYETGQLSYLSSRQPSVDFLQAMRAGVAAPYIYQRPVPVQGVNFCDGAILDPIPVEQAIAAGAENIILVLTREPGYRRGYPWLEYLLFRKQLRQLPEPLRLALDRWHEVYNAQFSGLDALRQRHPEISLTVIQPPRALRMNNIDNRQGKILEIMRHGYDDVVGHPTLAQEISAFRE